MATSFPAELNELYKKIGIDPDLVDSLQQSSPEAGFKTADEEIISRLKVLLADCDASKPEAAAQSDAEKQGQKNKLLDILGALAVARRSATLHKTFENLVDEHNPLRQEYKEVSADNPHEMGETDFEM
jgi:hypothetical protein